MVDDEKYDAIRCNADRKHLIKGILYEQCGALIGAVPKEEKVNYIFRCTVCGAWSRVIRNEPEDIVLEIEQLEKRRYNFSQPLRIGL